MYFLLMSLEVTLGAVLMSIIEKDLENNKSWVAAVNLSVVV
jgi:hypothetical protein